MIFLNVLLPLFFGGLIYVLFRSKSLNMFHWFESIGLQKQVMKMRDAIYPARAHLPTWLYYSLPDGLWAYSFSSAFIILWRDQSSIGKYWLLIPFTTGCLSEVAQGLGMMKGTFDVIDLAMYSLGIILSIVILKPKSDTHEKQVS
jgi:hypothetical protein